MEFDNKNKQIRPLSLDALKELGNKSNIWTLKYVREGGSIAVTGDRWVQHKDIAKATKVVSRSDAGRIGLGYDGSGDTIYVSQGSSTLGVDDDRKALEETINVVKRIIPDKTVTEL